MSADRYKSGELLVVLVQVPHEADDPRSRQVVGAAKARGSYIAMLRVLRDPVNSVTDSMSAGACDSASRSSHPPRPRPARSGATISRPMSHNGPSCRARTAPTSRPAARTHRRRPVVEPRSYVLEGFVEGWNIERVVGDGLIDPTAPLQHQQLGRIDLGCASDDCAVDGENTQRPVRHGGDHHPSSPSMLAEPSPDVTPFPELPPAHRRLFIQRKEPGGDSPRDVRQIQR